jgi:hypothetical protein
MGALASSVLSRAMIGTFGASLLQEGSKPTFDGAFAALLGAAACVGIATLLGLPVSTTHAIVGSVAGVYSFSLGFRGISWGAVGGDVTLPPATGHSFWLNGSALEYPGFDDAETFVRRLAKSGILSRDPIVDDTLLRRPGELSLRSSQRHFLRSTGVTYATFRQIERARYATSLLREGVSILDVVCSVGYFDQAHLTRSLGRFIGETPAKIIQWHKQLSFLYKTSWSAEAIVLP